MRSVRPAIVFLFALAASACAPQVEAPGGISASPKKAERPANVAVGRDVSDVSESGAVDHSPVDHNPRVDPEDSTPTLTDPVPEGAIVVAATGDDSYPGTAAKPLRTMSKAVSVAGSGSVIVIRGGTYHEAFRTPVNKALTIRSWPGEVVWFDGSEKLTGWVKDGSRWRMDGWTIDFDNSPTYTRGAADKQEVDWSFINPAHPMAAHPDQVWIDDVPQRQVASLSELAPGTFFEDSSSKKIYIGSDPSGHQVRASTLGRALLAQGPDTTVSGVNFRRFSPSVPDMGGVVFTGPRAKITNSIITEMATTGLAVINSDSTVRDVEVSYSGMLGIHAATADRLVLDRVFSHHNNTEMFNMAPVSGGFKFGLLRGLTIRNSRFTDNYGPGIWADESPYDMTITDSDFLRNAGHGISLELSAKALVANNRILDNGGFGIKVNNTSEVQIVNNTLRGNDRSINIVQDSRVATDLSVPGRDKRQPQPDPTMPWIVGPVLVQGNIVSHQRSGNCMLCVEDYSEKFSAEQLKVSAPGNLYSQTRLGSVKYFIVWSRGAGNPAVFNDVTSFSAATGQERAGRLILGDAPIDQDGVPTPGTDISGAPAVPASVSALSALPTGWRNFGALR